MDIEIKEGEFVFIMGFFGCGKFILFNILGFIDNLNGGEYFFLDEEVFKYMER